MKHRIVVVWATAALVLALVAGFALWAGIAAGGLADLAAGATVCALCAGCAVACAVQAADYWRWLR